MGHDLLLLDQPSERLLDELFSFFDIFENLLAKYEIATVDPDVRLLNRADGSNFLIPFDGHDVETLGGLDRKKGRRFIASMELS